MTTYYKAFACNGRTLHDRDPWPLPQSDRPGEWLPLITEVVPCESGYHVMTADQLGYWPGWSLYEVEGRGAVAVVQDDKVVVGQARILRKCDRWTPGALYSWLGDVVARSKMHAASAASAESAAWATSAASAASAAWAACAAERTWQAERMLEYINGTAKPMEVTP